MATRVLSSRCGTIARCRRDIEGKRHAGDVRELAKQLNNECAGSRADCVETVQICERSALGTRYLTECKTLSADRDETYPRDIVTNDKRYPIAASVDIFNLTVTTAILLDAFRVSRLFVE